MRYRENEPKRDLSWLSGKKAHLATTFEDTDPRLLLSDDQLIHSTTLYIKETENGMYEPQDSCEVGLRGTWRKND